MQLSALWKVMQSLITIAFHGVVIYRNMRKRQ